MIDEIKESDWKYLKKLKPMLLERACASINKEAESILKNEENRDQLQVYRALYRHYQLQDDMIAECFDDYRRSKAKLRILSLYRFGIMSDAELEGFSDDTKDFVRDMMELDRR
ncbi:MAG: hypothetical protein GTO45_01025 [Candidatus Aminicenantes bacterium]|nr:hypothetical protein [Candidatus Aminicenantes bacterium]NIM77349.1 hypothetical protein [Candidatus Aminicenantes bacterium]NIN16647.1 hypothetical protein [Candidatus Aminicenantes bacterium]NIN40505.1 hypothetical protein [Candidatus Aminicenantes bacterium]NIN83325.1 hypothetical protein [Candidatus Aminicenantes bacterium]